MKGDPKVIETLNSLLADELTAINQYMVHAEMCENWGYDKLGGVIQKRAVEEMKHAEKLIGRILFLEGVPVVSERVRPGSRRSAHDDVRTGRRARGGRCGRSVLSRRSKRMRSGAR